MLSAAASAGAVTPVRLRPAGIDLTAGGRVVAAAAAMVPESGTPTAAGAGAARLTMLDRDGRSTAAAARVAPGDAVVAPRSAVDGAVVAPRSAVDGAVVAPRSAVDSAGRSLVATLGCAVCPFEGALRAVIDTEPDVEDAVSVSAAAAGAAASAIPMPTAAAPTCSQPTTGSTRRLRCTANESANACAPSITK